MTTIRWNAAVIAAAAVLAAGGQFFTPNRGVTDVACSGADLAASITSAPAGSTLNLASSCQYVLTSALPAIAKDLTIRGNWSTLERSSASGTPAFTILAVNSGNVFISDLDFTNGGSGPAGQPASGTFSGGAINNGQGTVTISNGTFTGNTAAAGGAIENGAGTLHVTGASFITNGAKFGGAIDNESTATVSGGTFAGNTATSLGGALAASLDTTVSDSSFSRNTASFGGALWNGAATDVHGTTFTANAAGTGGAIENDGTLTVTGGALSNNIATVGGAVTDSDQGQSELSGTSLRLNQATTGGAVFNEDVVKLTGTTLSGNTAHGRGGGIYTNWLMTADSSHIDSNTAGAGGGIFNGDDFGPPGTVTLNGSTVSANQPDNCEGCVPAAAHRLTPGQRPGREPLPGLRAAAAAYAQLTGQARAR